MEKNYRKSEFVNMRRWNINEIKKRRRGLRAHVFFALCRCEVGVFVDEVAADCTETGGWLCEVVEGGDAVVVVAGMW